MYQFFVEPEQIDVAGKSVIIRGADVNHIKNVLRMKPGEELSVSTGTDSNEYRCGIVSLEEDCVLCELRFIKEADTELPAKIYLFQGLPKADKMELIVQKAVELGVYQVIPVAMKRCVVKLDEKKAAGKAARWQGIAEAAAKQSKRGIIPQVMPVVSFLQAVKMVSDMDVRIVPYELAEGMEKTKEIISRIKSGQQIAVFIGPEGGFAEFEADMARKLGMHICSMGERILRCETAPVVALTALMYGTGNL